MHRRNCRTTDVVGDIRPSRKCFSFSGCLLALPLLLLAISCQPATCRPSHDDELLPRHLNVDEEFRNVDNLEIHHVKVVNGVLQEDHPIIMYKEDFVDENYVPAKNATGRQRKYKDIAHRRRHKTTSAPGSDLPDEFNTKTEKIYFDFMPETPLVVPDSDNVKPRKSHYKLVPLADEMNDAKDTENQEDDGDDSPTKDELNKRPKKYHRRVRRDTRTSQDDHVVHKRNPFFRHAPQSLAEVQPYIHTGYIYVKHSVPGKKHNGLDIPVTRAPSKDGDGGSTPISFDNRIAADENDRVIVPGPRPTSRPRPAATRRPQEESIFRDPNPENYDFSFMNQNQLDTTTRRSMPTRGPESIFRDPSPENYDFSFMNKDQRDTTTRRSLPTRGPESIFRDPSPENYDFSFMNQGQRPTTTRRPMPTRAPESIFRDPSPENYDFSFMNQGQSSSSSGSSSSGSRLQPSQSAPARTTPRPASRPQPTQSTGISQCVWAIVNCCSNNDSEIRYSCFEQNGCYGAFWGLNPCAESVRDNFVSYVADYYN